MASVCIKRCFRIDEYRTATGIGSCNVAYYTGRILSKDKRSSVIIKIFDIHIKSADCRDFHFVRKGRH